MSRTEEIRARLDAATPGLWERENDGTGSTITSDTRGIGQAFNINWRNDADLIANAPADLAWLLDENERLAVTVARVEQVAEIAPHAWHVAIRRALAGGDQ